MNIKTDICILGAVPVGCELAQAENKTQDGIKMIASSAQTEGLTFIDYRR